MAQLKVSELIERLKSVPRDAKLFVYVGSEELIVQAEWPSIDPANPTDAGHQTVMSAEVSFQWGGMVK